MTSRLPLPSAQSIFREDEPVIQSHPTLEGSTSPLFGNTICWDINGVVHKPPNLHAAGYRVLFRGLSPEWNLLARELGMIWFNPRHPAVLAHGLHLPPGPLTPTTVSQRAGHLRALAAYGVAEQLPPSLTDWSDDDFKSYIAHRCELGDDSSATGHVHVIKALTRFRHALACGGRARDPWPDLSSGAVVNQPVVAGLKTPAVVPETWFPLVRAAWTYINQFGPDILRAIELWHQVQDQARPAKTEEADRLLNAWLADPDSKVPVRRTATDGWEINWSLLTWMIGAVPEKLHFFTTANRSGRARRAAAERLLSVGRSRESLIDDLAEVTRPDGGRGPWHQRLQPRELWVECLALRNACYIFVAALSMMRDCEIREITKGSVVEHYGSPAVKSTKRKLDPDLPTKHWWIIAPVAEAIDTASRMSLHAELAFAAVTPRFHGEGFTSQTAITRFINHVNRHRNVTGLSKIPLQKVTPHMFRRTMAMLTRDFPGSEIAVGMQLKHVATRALANRSTQGYMDHAPSWARHLDSAITERRFERLKDLFDADGRGEIIGYGPGADQMREAFAAVREKAEALRVTGQARRGDIRVEHDLLRRTRLSIRFGKLNHCTMNDDDPAGAKCLEDAVVPAGHKGPLIDRCQPARCANSVIGPEHLPIWQAERSSLLKLLDTSKLAPNHRAHIVSQLRDVSLVVRRVNP
ncbi:hypothetical protein [[Kitasatospora] papulosa]|uniref:hypothetical protein n=1 Tax=[Kitasatospora] papulosa TaxID=1464011 RepID=UPI003857B0DC